MDEMAREALERLLKPKRAEYERHCPTCTCDPDTTDFRVRQRKLFRNTPTTGCLHHEQGSYCGEPCTGNTDYCKRHRRG